MPKLYKPVHKRLRGPRLLILFLTGAAISITAHAQPETFDPGHGPLAGEVRSVSIVKGGTALGGRDTLIEKRFEFSREGRLTTVIEPEVRKGVTRRTAYGYDSDGRLIEVHAQYASSSKQKQPGYRWRYRYDRAGHIVEKIVTTSSGNDVTMRVTYENDSLGRRTAMNATAMVGRKPQPVFTSTTYFGRRGGSAERRMIYEKGMVSRSIDIRKEPDGQLKGITTVELSNGRDTVEIETLFFNDKGWERQKEKRSYPDPAQMEAVTYTYPVIDDRGNWLKRTVVTTRTKPGSPEEITERMEERIITYY